ncbi:DUF2085 domain-containing protein [Oscillochloris sp. ZM17-4]|uniref:DUF2085 domain-containing protein n=1 Tax=Oscillochloris sp. ZM17-4 TaxID=2866714 RepID=UPI001C73AE94|nr:DUF2085 domain-containing protein [Oscillochloris sp. ZM17-4]MBX0327303.1 DUF2085 domain-containing protein [Oscillochloris sp. ZM17-4]
MATSTLRLNHYRPWPRWAFDLILWVLFLGPIISPLFRATGLPGLTESGLLARDLLSRYVCPTPDRSIMLLGLPMAVCVRCWGATIGLWAARLLVGAQGDHAGAPLRWFRGLPWAARLALAALPFLLWPLEIVGHYQGWWFAPLWLLLINGAQAGFASGLFFCSIWPGLWPAPAR